MDVHFIRTVLRGRKVCEFVSLSITNKPDYLKEFEKYEITDKLEKLKEICNRYKK